MRAVNPVLRRELVERWRSRRAVVTLTLYLGVLGGVMYLLYRLGQRVLSSQIGFGGVVDAATAGPVLGRFLLEGLLFFILALVLFVAPGYAAAQLSGERERRTLPLLQVTMLRPVQIVLGKLGASVAWLTLLVTAAVPLGAAAFFLGGIALGDLLRGMAVILVIAVSVAAMALGVSSLTKRTTGSVVLTYGLVALLTGGTAFLAIVEFVFRSTRGDVVGVPLALYLNPFLALADAVHAAPGFGGMGELPSPLGLIAQALPQSRGIVEDVAVAVEEGAVLGRQVLVGPGAGPDVGLGFEAGVGPELVWVKILVIYVCLGAVALLVATRRVRAGRTAARPGGTRRGRRGGAGPVPGGAPVEAAP